ncbi:MAG: hypothetical protein ABW106_12800 [Steroidobacteraceae bacterium]
MRPVTTAVLLAMMSLQTSVLLAAEPPAPSAPAPTTEKAEPPKPMASPKEAAAAAVEEPAETSGKGPVKNPDKGPSPQRFIPSEQVRADFDVSFPIDI